MVNFSTLQSLTLGVLLSSPLAVGTYVQINYYSDGGCQDYVLSIPNPPGSTVYNYQYSGTNSANIANCDGYLDCSCTFYTEPNGQGNQQFIMSDDNDCASNWGGGFQSFKCTYRSDIGPQAQSRSVRGNF